MANKLVIVESPAKAKTIQKYLGPGFRVTASMGHVRDLPKSKFGVDVEHGFEPAYEVSKDKEKVVQELRRQIREAEAVYLATDPDREGEAIAWHITEATGIASGKKKPVFRVTFTEITRDAVRQAVANPRQIDRNLVDAQQARRVLDRLVGYKLSPLLWQKVKRGLSAGRVQSVAVRLVVQREREIESFVPQEYWTIEADLTPGRVRDNATFRAVLFERAGKKLDKFSIENQEQADGIVSDLQGASYQVVKIARKDKRRTPSPPFITSTLQQEASRRLGFSAKKTMQIAQQLYEGVDVGGDEGTVGLITYMRTDSTNVAREAQEEARQVIKERYGPDYVPGKPPVYKTRSRNAQEAHEAIRPTASRRAPERLRNHVTRDQYRLYELIWKRFIASQMAPAVFDSTTVDIAASGRSKTAYLFRATGSVLKFPGFLAVYNVGLDEGEEDEDREAVLPPLQEGQALTLIELLALQHFTTPPPRYTEASLVKELERLGIGRPSTYAPTLGTIQQREYVEVADKKLVPTTLGGVVTDLLVEHFPDIVDYSFTSDMEARLDDIADGERQWVPVLKEFYGPFESRLRQASREMREVKREEIPTDLSCPTCGEVLLIKWGRHGEFLACSRYPECSFTSNLTRDGAGNIAIAHEPQVSEEVHCPICERAMVVKRSRFGPFMACTGYPECKGTRKLRQERNGSLVVVPEPKPSDEQCPKCGKPMVQKEGRYGPFLSCTGYPKCRTIVRPKAAVEASAPPCPDCGTGQLLQRRGRGGRAFWGCSRYPECQYTSNKPPATVAA